jgi:hypothetical protein
MKLVRKWEGQEEEKDEEEDKESMASQLKRVKMEDVEMRDAFSDVGDLCLEDLQIMQDFLSHSSEAETAAKTPALVHSDTALGQPPFSEAVLQQPNEPPLILHPGEPPAHSGRPTWVSTSNISPKQGKIAQKMKLKKSNSYRVEPCYNNEGI